GSSNDVVIWFDKGQFSNVQVRDNIAAQWAASETFRKLPSSGVTLSGNRLNLDMDDLNDPAYLMSLESDTFLDSLVAKGFQTKQEFHALLIDVWRGIDLNDVEDDR